MKQDNITDMNIFAIALVDKMKDEVEYINAYEDCYMAQMDAIYQLIEHKDSKNESYRVYVLDDDMYCTHSYCLYNNEIMELPGGFLDEMLSEKIVDFMYHVLLHRIALKFLNEFH